MRHFFSFASSVWLGIPSQSLSGLRVWLVEKAVEDRMAPSRAHPCLSVLFQPVADAASNPEGCMLCAQTWERAQ